MAKQANPILTKTLTLTDTVAANRFVTFAGAQAGADANTYGVAVSGGVSGAKVPVTILGTETVEAGAAVTAGDTLKSDSSGRAITWASSGAKVGRALETASAAGQFIEVQLVTNVA